jgi:hypothetical protein
MRILDWELPRSCRTFETSLINDVSAGFFSSQKKGLPLPSNARARPVRFASLQSALVGCPVH